MIGSSKTLWITWQHTSEQAYVAARLGIDLASEDTFIVAQARILDAVAETIGETPRHDPTEKQRHLASELGIDISEDSRRVAWAKIRQTTQKRYYDANVEAIQRMQLVPGDVVFERKVIRGPTDHTSQEIIVESTDVVSSIRWDGLVYFKGGRGRASWAQLLTKVDTPYQGAAPTIRWVNKPLPQG